MKVALVKNNVVENVVEVESLVIASTIFADYECLDASTPINQDYESQTLGIGFIRQKDGTWKDPYWVPWVPPSER